MFLWVSHCFLFLHEQFQLNQDKMNFSTLRNIQGLHAPLKLQMEYRAARQVAAVLFQVFSCFVLFFSFSVLTPTVSSLQIQRLPFLQSSNLALDTLRNSDESIGFEDVLNGGNLVLPFYTFSDMCDDVKPWLILCFCLFPL